MFFVSVAVPMVGSGAIKVPSELEGLQQLSLFGCKLGAAAVEGAGERGSGALKQG
jgi:hypothetical protein